MIAANRHYIIVADGNFLISEIIHEAVKDKVIVALDTAADKLMRIGITPHVLLGDFDSDSQAHIDYWGIRQTFHQLSNDEKPYTGNHDVVIVPRKNQNHTDLMKAIHYCDEQNAKSITLICALGGRLDHHEAALRSMRSEYKKERHILLHTEQQTLRVAKDETIVINGQRGDKCAILAFPHGILSSQGLEYDVNEYELNFGYSESIANALRDDHATVTITGEALIMMPPQLSSQREFMNKNEVEQLELLLRDAKQI